MILILIPRILYLFCFMLASSATADTFVGFSLTQHLLSEGLNDYHPLVGTEFSNVGATVYLNSFNKVSLGVYTYNRWDMFNKTKFVIKTGLTTGYKKSIHYKGNSYVLSTLFVADGIMATVVPGVEYGLPRGDLVYEQVGDAVSLGYKISLGTE